MGIVYEDLDEETREYMLEELQRDIKDDALYYSSRFNSKGKANWPELLENAIENYDDEWLAKQLRKIGAMKSYEKKKSGGAKVPKNAPKMLAEGQFNRFYIRGLCKRAIEEGISEVEVYRGKQVRNPRPKSQKLVGERFDPKRILQDVRNSKGEQTDLGIPGGPNSGITVRLP